MQKRITHLLILLIVIAGMILFPASAFAESNAATFPGNAAYTTDAFYYSDQYMWKVSLYVAKNSDTQMDQITNGTVNSANFYDNFYRIGDQPIYLRPETTSNGTPWYAGQRPSNLSALYFSQSTSKLDTLLKYNQGGLDAVDGVSFGTAAQVPMMAMPTINDENRLPYVPNLSDGDIYDNGVIKPECVGQFARASAYFQNDGNINKILDKYASMAGTTREGLIQGKAFTLEGTTKTDWNPLSILPNSLNGNQTNCVNWVVVYEPVAIVYVSNTSSPGSYFGYALTATDFSVTQLKKQMDWMYDETRWPAWAGNQPDAWKPNADRQHVQRLSNLIMGNSVYPGISWFGLEPGVGVDQNASIPFNRWTCLNELKAGGYGMVKKGTPLKSETRTDPDMTYYQFRPNTDVVVSCPVYPNKNSSADLSSGPPTTYTITYTFNYTLNGEAKSDTVTDTFVAPFSQTTLSYAKWHTPDFTAATDVTCVVVASPYPECTVRNGLETKNINIKIVPLSENTPPDPKVDDTAYADLDKNFTLPTSKAEGADNKANVTADLPKTNHVEVKTPAPNYWHDKVTYQVVTNSVTQTLNFIINSTGETIGLTKDRVAQGILDKYDVNPDTGEITWTLTFIPADLGANSYTLVPVSPDRGEGERTNISVDVLTDPDNPIITQVLISPLKAIYTLYTEVVATPLDYQVDYNTMGGNAMDSETVKYDTLLSEPIPPTREGYSFAGWFKDQGYLYPWNFSVDRVESATTLYAKWSINTYNVTFDVQGGDATISPVTAEYGKNIAKPADPTRFGYRFGGWFTDVGCSEPWNFDLNTVKADTTLYAKWNQQSFTASYDAMGGSEVESQTVDYNALLTAPNPPTKVGYIFSGWYKESACTNAWTWSSDRVSGDLTLYAKWIAKNCTVTFDTGAGSAIADVIIQAGNIIAKPADPTRAGYTFGGFFQDNLYTQTWDFATQKVMDNMTLFSKWTPQASVITFHTNSGTVVSTMNGNTDQVIVQRTMPNTGRDGFTFDGWYLHEDFSGDKQTELPEKFPVGSLDYYAKWVINQYMVDFQENGGNEVPNAVVNYGGKVAEPSPETAQDGHTFAGWFSDVDLTQIWDFVNNTINGFTSLYAKWATNDYTVTYEANGGTAIAPVTQAYDTLLTQPETTRYGYTLVGWYQDAGLSQAWDFVNNPLKQTMTLYASWSMNTYRLADLFADASLAEQVRLEINTHADRIGNPITDINAPTVTQFDLDQVTSLNLDGTNSVGMTEDNTLGLFKSVYAAEGLPKITSLNGIGKLKNLTSLNLKNNALTSLPDELGSLTGIKDINISGNQLTAVPDSFFQLSGIQSLDLSGNKLTAIQSGIGNLTGVTNLLLNNNNMTALPEELWDLNQVTTLNLSNNVIPTLSVEIGNMTKLQSLTIANMGLSDLPYSIGTLSPLTSLDASGNALTTVPDVLKGLSGIKTINLSNNQIDSLSNTVVGSWTSLEQLNLASNHLAGLPSNVDAMNLLKELNLSGNAITQLPDNLTLLTGLEQLNVAGNSGLHHLPLSMGNMTGLTHLFVDGTGIDQLPLSLKDKGSLVIDKTLPFGYAVTFDTQGGNAIAGMTSDYTARISRPTVDPTREGYDFAGWSKDASGTTPWDFNNDTIQGSTSIYATWTARQSTIKFETNGGSAVADLVGVTGQTISPTTLPTATKDNVQLGGWYDNASFTGDALTALPGQYPAGGATYYAKWQATVTFDSQGGSAVDSYTVDCGKTLAAPSTPSLDGYVFKGWFKESSCTTQWNFGSDKITGDMTLYAKWEEGIPDASVPLNDWSWNQIGKIADLGLAESYFVVGEEKTITLSTGEVLTLQIYGFNHDTLADGTSNKAGITFGLKNLMNENHCMNPGNTNNDGYIGSDMRAYVTGITTTHQIQSYATSSVWSQLPATLTPFIKTVKKESSGGYYDQYIRISNDKVFLFSVKEVLSSAAAYILTGEGSQYSIFSNGEPITKKHANGSEDGWFLRSSSYNRLNGFFMVNPYNKDVYEAVTSSQGGVNFGFCIGNAPTNQYTVSYNSNGGSTVTSTTATLNTALTAPTEPTKSGYALLGWYKDAGLTQKWDFATDKITGNMTLYAKWGARITYDSQGGTAVSSVVVPCNTTFDAPSSPSKDGYVFKGWYKESACLSPWTFVTDTPTGNTTLYAKWQVGLPDSSVPLNNWSWDQINQVAELGLAQSYFDIGETKDIIIGGIGTVTVQILGFGQDILADGSGNRVGVTFGLKDALPSCHAMNIYSINDGGWDSSEMRSWLALMQNGFSDASLRSSIKNVYKYSGAGPSLGNVRKTSIDKLFLFSEKEVYGSNVSSASGEGVWYTYWQQHNSNSERSKLISDNNPYQWNLRSASTTSSSLFGCVGHAGWQWGELYGQDAGSAAGVVFGFCIGNAPTNQYMVSYNTNGGSAVASTTATLNTTIAAPNAPTKANAIFDSWYKDAALTVPFNFLTDKITGNTTLYAKWKTLPALGTPLADCTWDQIAMVANAGLGDDYWNVGDTKNLTLSPSGEVLTMEIYGFDHDDKADGSGKANITFGTKNLMAAGRAINPGNNTNYYGWAGSDVRGWTNGINTTYAGTKYVSGTTSLYSQLPADARTQITEVKKMTSGGYNNQTLVSSNDKVFLFSEVEVYGTHNYSLLGEGTQYPVFTDNTSRIKYLSNGSGGATWWWLRSPYYDNGNYFTGVDVVGFFSGAYANDDHGVAFGFCMGTAPQYTVTFDTQGGSAAPAAQTVEIGKTITKPTTDPTKSGAGFGGWYKDAACTTAWDFANDKVTGSTTLYAKWVTLPAVGVSLESCSWEQIAAISKAGLGDTYFNVGNEKIVNINGTNYAFQIYGFDHDDKADGSGKANITFGMKGVMTANHYMNPANKNQYGWVGSDMRAWLNGVYTTNQNQDYTTGTTSIWSQIPADLKAQITPVKKYTSGGYNDQTLKTSTDNLFLFSTREVAGVEWNTLAGEGQQYPIFSDDTSRIKNYPNNSAAWWRLRSPYYSYPDRFTGVGITGNYNTYDGASGSVGVAFGFSI